MKYVSPVIVVGCAILAVAGLVVGGCDRRDGRCAGLNERDRALCSEVVTQEGYR